jgi:hypothetical protein
MSAQASQSSSSAFDWPSEGDGSELGFEDGTYGDDSTSKPEQSAKGEVLTDEQKAEGATLAAELHALQEDLKSRAESAARGKHSATPPDDGFELKRRKTQESDDAALAAALSEAMYKPLTEGVKRSSGYPKW